MNDSINIWNLEQFNNFLDEINPKFLEYKYNYFFRNNSDTIFYEIMDRNLGEFLCLYTDLFQFNKFVISSAPFRLYKINSEYKNLYQKYIEMFQNIYNIFKDIKVKSLNQTISILTENGYTCYNDKECYPMLYWNQYGKKTPTLYIKNVDNVKIRFPYYFASNIKNNIIQIYFKKIIDCL